MGQDMSGISDNIPSQTLESRSIEAVARLIKDGQAKRIVILTGAGISTAAGIPDFRSPGTGLYNNLQRLNLPYAEAVFDIEYFEKNPNPFYILARDLYPGKFHPTVSHAFIALLHKKGLLQMLFTQNIDCLERAAGVPEAKIVEAHGSFAKQRCIKCKSPFTDDAKMREHIREARPPHCRQSSCDGLVKPDIVFFGESLPPRFNEFRNLPATHADLVLVLGTSLSVFPFARLATIPPQHVPRVLFNREVVGDIGSRADDVVVLGSCDAGVLKMADSLGWRKELEELWRGLVGDTEADRQLGQDAILSLPHTKRDDSDLESEDGGGSLVTNVVCRRSPSLVAGEHTPAAEAEVDAIASDIRANLRLDEEHRGEREVSREQKLSDKLTQKRS